MTKIISRIKNEPIGVVGIPVGVTGIGLLMVGAILGVDIMMKVGAGLFSLFALIVVIEAIRGDGR